MGCAVSKSAHLDAGSVTTAAAKGPQQQCELRKSSVKHAVAAQTSLATAHARYVQSISATAALFKQFGDEEFGGDSSHSGDEAAEAEAEVEAEAEAEAEAASKVAQRRSSIPPVSSSTLSSSFSDESSSSSEIVVTTSTTTTRHTMRLWNHPTEPITEILSPPRNVSLYRLDDDEEEEEDEDDGMFYRPPPPPPAAYHSQQQQQQHRRASSPPPMPAAEGEDWKYYDIFHTPLRYRHVLPDGDEDMPALESDDGDEAALHQSKRETQRYYEDEVKLDERKGKAKVVEEDEEVEEEEASSSGTSGRLEIDREGSKESRVEEKLEQAVPAASPWVLETDELKEKHTKQKEQNQQARSDSLGSPRQLVDVIKEQFLRASEAGRPLLRLLEARKLHNNLERGLSDQSSSSRLLSALSLGHWSPRSFSSSREDFESLLGEAGGLSGSHAATLDRLYAWEKKMFEEVKSWENLTVEFDKKRKVLRNLDAKGAKAEAIERTRASMKQLETQISVALQAIEASSVSIQKITDEQVLPQLMEILEGFTEMWKGMHESHSHQLRVVQQSRFFQYPVLEPTTTNHRNVTIQLESTFTSWYTSLNSLVSAEKEYVYFLTRWVKHASVQPPSEGGSKRPLHRRTAARVPKIQYLCEQWHNALNVDNQDAGAEKRAQRPANQDAGAEKKTQANQDAGAERGPANQDEKRAQRGSANQDAGFQKRGQMASGVEKMGAAIKAFAETLREIGRQQAEEIRIQKRADTLAKELKKKTLALNNLEKKRSLGTSRDKQDALATQIKEKKAVVDALRAKVENERQNFSKAIRDTRLMTLNSLQDGLPKLFKALEESSANCTSAYQDLYTLVREYPANN